MTTTTDQSQSTGEIVLTVNGREIVVRPFDGSNYYVGLMFFPWLNSGSQEHRGLWYFMRSQIRPYEATTHGWNLFGPAYETYEEARAAMEQYNEMVRTQTFTWRMKETTE